MRSTSSAAESAFAWHWQRLYPDIPLIREHRFAPPRRWRFDFAYPAAEVAVEIDGGNWTRGRHTRGAGFESDCEKVNAAICQGWWVFHFTPGMLQRDPEGCCRMVAEAIGKRR